MNQSDKINLIAQICHEANRIYCLALGDHSQEPWESAAEWQKTSAVHGVQFHLLGDKTPEQSHESWLKEKVSLGWKFGMVKDPEKKTHPCLLPYDQLPEAQKVKDELFTAIVNVFK